MKKNSGSPLMFMEAVFREQVEPRRKQEHIDSQLLSKNMTSIANFPQEPINRTWNPGEYVEHFFDPINEKVGR